MFDGMSDAARWLPCTHAVYSDFVLKDDSMKLTTGTGTGTGTSSG